MKRIFLFNLFLAFLFLGMSSGYSQSEEKKESEIVKLIISFEQKRFSKPDEAKKEIEQAIAIAETAIKKNNLVSTKILLGEYYYDNNNFNKALSVLTEAEVLAKEINDISGLAKCQYNLGFLYYNQGKTENALIHFKEAIEYAQQTKDKFLLAKAYNAISLTYIALNQLDKANTNSVSGLILFRELKQTNRMAQSYLILSRINNKKDEFAEAIEYLDSAIVIFDETRNMPEMNNAKLAKVEIFFRKKDYKKAIIEAKKVEESPDVMLEQKLYALNLLYQINKSMNKTSASLDYLEESKGIQDSLFQLERDKMSQSVFSEVEAKNRLETLEKESEISRLQLEQSKYLTWALIGLSVLLLLVTLISFMFYRQNKMKSEREKIKLEQESIQLEQKLLRTQMNPHFIANSLAAIQGNIYKQDKEKSVTYLSKFAKLMRFILESSREKEVMLEKEIISLTNYLDLQKLLLEEKLTYQINIAKDLNVDEYKIPPMLIQPFIENAIVHGIELKIKPGNVLLEFKKEKENLKVIIQDDGLGRKKVNEIYEKRKSSHLSFSTNITNERIEKMNTESKENIYSTTKDLMENGEVCGTIVELILPLKSVY
jgi:tetratricopeptide (TPR) repeat protein|tara:strand:- start:2343 stop:4139 length:1797 start_codon:yes stop_codon:yes gene_type:complete